MFCFFSQRGFYIWKIEEKWLGKVELFGRRRICSIVFHKKSILLQRESFLLKKTYPKMIDKELYFLEDPDEWILGLLTEGYQSLFGNGGQSLNEVQRKFYLL